MMGLVDYGSESDSDAEHEAGPGPALSIEDNSFASTDETGANGAGLLQLPTASTHSRVTTKSDIPEEDLESVVKPREWELKLAEKAERKKSKLKKKEKKEKKAKKREKKELEKLQEPHKPSVVRQTEKKKIAAFGALAAIPDSDSDEEENRPRPPPSSSEPRQSGLLGLLPKPKSSAKTTIGSKTGGLLVPPSVRNKPPVQLKAVIPAPSAVQAKRKLDSDDSDDEITDAFGLSSASEPKLPRMDAGIPMIPSCGLAAAVGPSRPTHEDFVDPSQMYQYTEPGPSAPIQGVRGFISDEEALRLLSRDDSIASMDRRSLTDIAGSIVDINVGQELGPNVNSNILKNLTKKALVKESLPQVPKSKNPVDRMAKEKHQITYLANLAVAREEALQEQWAANKIKKRMGREKYGF